MPKISPTGQVRFQRHEVLEQVRIIEQLYLLGVPQVDMIRAIEKKCGYTISKSRVCTIVQQIQDRHKVEDAKQWAHNKSRQLRRIEANIRTAMDKQNLQALAKFEALYADLAGTREPVRVSYDVQISQSLQVLLATMTATDIENYLAEARRTNELASAMEQAIREAKLPADVLLPKAPIIDVQAVPDATRKLKAKGE